MRESMTLIEQANILNKTNHQSFFFDRTSSKQNLHIYPSSRYFLPNITKQKKSYHTEKLILPPIDKDENRSRKKTRRPSYRTSIYHSNSNSRSSTRIDLSSLTARGTKPELITTKPELITTLKDDSTVMSLQRHHAPPPSPSDDHIKLLFTEFNRTKQFTPIETDGNIPYRLPALNQPARERPRKMNIPPKDLRLTLSNYLQTFY